MDDALISPDGRLENSTTAEGSAVDLIELTVNVNGKNSGTVVGEQSGEGTTDNLRSKRVSIMMGVDVRTC